jgi:hypothetical protein
MLLLGVIPSECLLFVHLAIGWVEPIEHSLVAGCTKTMRHMLAIFVALGWFKSWF